MFRRRQLTVAVLSVPLLVAACESDEDKARTRVAADYAVEFDGRPRTPFYARQVLSLRVNGTWKRTTHLEINGKIEDSPADSGTFRIQGVTLALRSLVAPGAPVTYTVSGDTLYNVSAAKMQAFLGYDGEDEPFVRVR